MGLITLNKGGRSMARPAMRCDFVAPDGTLLSDYPWTGSREVRPGSNQWIHVPSDLQYGDLTGRHIVQSGKCQGSLANSHARTHIDIGSPMRRALLKLQASRTDIEIDNSFNFRVPAGNPPGLSTTTGLEIQRPCTIRCRFFGIRDIPLTDS